MKMRAFSRTGRSCRGHFVERLESRQLLSATFSVRALPGNPVGDIEVMNNAGQIAGNFGPNEGAFFYSNGKVTNFAQPDPSLNEIPFVAAINSTGQVVGSMGDERTQPSQAFLFSQGKFTLLGLFGGISSAAYAINDSGTIAGQYQSVDGVYHGFIYKNGKMTDIGGLGNGNTYVDDINNAGQVVGESDLDSSGAISHAFVYSNGKMKDIDPNGPASSEATHINDAGQIIGNENTGLDSKGFFYASGKLTHLQLAAGARSRADVLSSASEVAGSATNAQGKLVLFTYKNGAIHDLGGVSDAVAVGADCINKSGEIVGFFIDSNQHGSPFLYENGFVDLNYDKAVTISDDPSNGPTPSTFTQYDRINDSGQIAVGDDLGNDFLLTPAAPGSISGTVFHDSNADGQQNFGEKGVGGVQVYDDVFNAGSFQNGDPTTTTSAAGSYALGHLAPGPHVIRFVGPTTNWKQSSHAVNLGSGQNASHVNFATLPLYNFQLTDPGVNFFPSAINNVGQIAGRMDEGNGTSRPFLYTIATGKFTDLSSKLGSDAVVTGMNDQGDMVGVLSNAPHGTLGFIYYKGKKKTLKMPTGADSGGLVGINDKGQVIGKIITVFDGKGDSTVLATGVVYSADTGKALTYIPGVANYAEAIAINNNGDVFEDTTQSAEFNPPFGGNAIYSISTGKLTQLPLKQGTKFSGPWFGDPVSPEIADSTQNYSDLIGGSLTEFPSFYSGANSVKLIDLLSKGTDLDLEDSNPLINASDVMVGFAVDSKEQYHGYLLTPVLASISGTIFNDANGDGAKQPGEQPAKGWTVYADVNGNSKHDAGELFAVSDAKGQYTISGLAPGGYVVRVVPQSGWHQTAPSSISQTIVAAGQKVAGPTIGEQG